MGDVIPIVLAFVYIVTGIAIMVEIETLDDSIAGVWPIGACLWPVVLVWALATRERRTFAIARLRHLSPSYRRQCRMERDYEECLNLIGYQPKPESYWRVREIEWDAQLERTGTL